MRQIANVVLGEERRQIAEIARLTRSANEAEHGAPYQHHMTVAGFGCLGDALNTGDIGGKRGDGNAPCARFDNLDETGGDFGFGSGCAYRKDIGAVADNGTNALVADLGEAVNVHMRAD